LNREAVLVVERRGKREEVAKHFTVSTSIKAVTLAKFVFSISYIESATSLFFQAVVGFT
jgi:hypothetical protein